MRNKMEKSYQHALNKKIRELNKACENDDLWRGRFVVRQVKARWEQFRDGSGGILYVILRVYDKKTKYYKDYPLDYFKTNPFINWNLTMDIMNTFIVDDLDVWRNEKPREDKVDWRKVPIPERMTKLPLNLYEGGYI
jgi:hypothetical protein